MKKAILLGSLAIALAACNNDESTAIDTADNGQALFSASIEGQNKTRAYDTTWDPNDKIGISGTTGDKTYTNVAYRTDGGTSVNFTIATTGTEIYYQDDATVDFTAYYPWKNLAPETTTIAADTWGQKAQKSFDFLYATSTGSKGNPNVAFTFSHKMAKLALTIKKGTDITFEEVKAAVLSLEGFKHTGTFNITDGEIKPGDAGTVMWQFANNQDENENYNAPYDISDADQTVTYSLIMFPQAFGSNQLPFYAELTKDHVLSAKLDFTAANENAGDKEPLNEWKAGRQYNMSVTLNKTSITVNGCTISKWKDANGGNVDAN